MVANTCAGDDATPHELEALADQYRMAAQLLRGEPKPRAPFHLIAIHAVELYLNAYLRLKGVEWGTIRGWKHDLAPRAQRAIFHGLKLDDRTAGHLLNLDGRREYLVWRYDAKFASPTSPMNRIEATLKEVAAAVKAAFSPVKAAASANNGRARA